jgi:hypothetical protein
VNDIKELFAAARANPNHPMNRPGRLMGRHCRARLFRGVAKRIARDKTPFNPAGPAGATRTNP